MQLKLSKYKAFIFDMDGTMVDNMMVHHRAWQEKLAEMGLPMSMEEVIEQIHGVNEEILLRLFGEKYSPEERKRHAADKEARYRSIYKDSLALISGLNSFLELLTAKGYPLAIGSAAPPENVDFVLDSLNIRSLFRAILHSGDVEKGKPNPEIYLKIMDKLGVSPAETLIFEDSTTGAKAAENAGCDVAIVTTVHQPEEFANNQKVIGFINTFDEIEFID